MKVVWVLQLFAVRSAETAIWVKLDVHMTVLFVLHGYFVGVVLLGMFLLMVSPI